MQSLLLGLRYSELSWEMAKPSDEGNLDCLPCLFLQFPVRENGARVYKILQVFSRQVWFIYRKMMMLYNGILELKSYFIYRQ